jgi:hypothetical protein
MVDRKAVQTDTRNAWNILQKLRILYNFDPFMITGLAFTGGYKKMPSVTHGFLSDHNFSFIFLLVSYDLYILPLLIKWIIIEHPHNQKRHAKPRLKHKCPLVNRASSIN